MRHPRRSRRQRARRASTNANVLGLEQLLANARLIFVFVPCALLMAYLAASEGEMVWALVWLAAMIARDIYAYFQVNRLRKASLSPTAEVVREIEFGFVVAGIVTVALLPVFFARSNNNVLLVVMVLVGIHTSGTREQAGGILRGGSLGLAMAGGVAALFPVTVFAIQARRREMLNMVRLIDDNEILSSALAKERDRVKAERDRAEAASASKTRFFAAASHDLRQPLHALSINATTLDLVARRSGDLLLKEVSQGISSALRQSTGLLDGLLDISRLDAHAVKLRLAPHDIGAVLAAVREEYAALAAQHGLTLDVELGAALDAELEPAGGKQALWVLTDVDQLVRILGNLVDNAIKFTREGGIRLAALREDSSSEKWGRVLIRVSDTGPGIAAAERERVFEEFYQIGNPSRDRAQGLGLGLAIVKRTAALLEIPVRLVCEPGHGTRFELSLPAAGAQEAGHSPAAGHIPQVDLPGPADLGGQEAAQSLSILLVDDEPEVRASMCTYLRQIGWLAQGVASGAEAEQAVAGGFKADVLVVDFRLRNETGLDVITRLRALYPALPAIIVTGDTAAQRLREFEGVAERVLHKPLDGKSLARALAGIVRH